MEGKLLQYHGHNAYHIANFILARKNNTLTPLHVNKLVYFSHGWMLGLYNRPLISEQVEAWNYGPVIPSIYHLFKYNGARKIRFEDYFNSVYDNLDAKESDITCQVINLYGNMSGSELIDLTHEEGSPWNQYYNELEGTIIPNHIIKEYFENQSNDDAGY